jgi:hypothetical protein
MPSARGLAIGISGERLEVEGAENSCVAAGAKDLHPRNGLTQRYRLAGPSPDARGASLH